MARTRRAAADVATTPATRSAQFAPKQKMHRAPRMIRKPLGTLDANTRSVKKQVVPTGKKAAAKRSAKKVSQAPTKASAGRSSSPPLTIPTQPLEDSQRIAESIYASSNVPAATPSAAEHSILALKNFIRRPRQPSMLNMVKQRIASARSSSVAHDVPVFGSDDFLDMDDFLPDAAGTPMHVVEQPLQAPVSTGNKRKRAHDEVADDAHLDSVDRSLLKFRKLVSQSSEESIGDDLPILASQASRVESTPERAPNNLDMTLNITELAAGTSPVTASSDLSPLRQDVVQSDVNAPPLSQYTPPRKTRTAAKATVAPSSAILQSLLPKRRKRFDTDRPVPALRLSDSLDDGQYDLPSSPASGAADLSEYQAGHRKVGGSKTKSSRVGRRTAMKTKHAKMSRNEHNTDADTRSRTYSRRRANDKADPGPEMQGPLDEPSTTLEAALISKELQAARKKFQEIDKWEMDFETLTSEESRSSSQNWR